MRFVHVTWPARSTHFPLKCADGAAFGGIPVGSSTTTIMIPSPFSRMDYPVTIARIPHQLPSRSRTTAFTFIVIFYRWDVAAADYSAHSEWWFGMKDDDDDNYYYVFMITITVHCLSDPGPINPLGLYNRSQFDREKIIARRCCCSTPRDVPNAIPKLANVSSNGNARTPTGNPDRLQLHFDAPFSAHSTNRSFVRPSSSSVGRYGAMWDTSDSHKQSRMMDVFWWLLSSQTDCTRVQRGKSRSRSSKQSAGGKPTTVQLDAA